MTGDVARRVVLTGASRGIGAAIARALTEDGARLAILVRDAGRVAGLLEAGGVTVIEADLLVAEPEVLIDAAAAALGGIDVLINCAGIVEYEGVTAITAGAIERQMRLNFAVPLRLAQAAARHMRAQGTGGDILSLASTLAVAPAPLTTVYAASKAALIAASRSLALELASDGIRANAIAPGVVETDMVRTVRLQPGEGPLSPAVTAARVESQLEALRALHPLGRLGQPGDVVAAVRYLLASPWVTGTVLTVDGGLSLGSPPG